MGYRVEYTPVKKVRGLENRISRAAALTAVFLVVFLVLVNVFWQKGREVLQSILFPGDWAVTAAALEKFVEDLGQGEPVAYAIESFCRDVIKGAGIGQG